MSMVGFGMLRSALPGIGKNRPTTSSPIFQVLSVGHTSSAGQLRHHLAATQASAVGAHDVGHRFVERARPVLVFQVRGQVGDGVQSSCAATSKPRVISLSRKPARLPLP